MLARVHWWKTLSNDGHARFARHTFTDSILRAHLSTIFHCVQGEVDLGDLLLILHCADRIVDVLRLVDLLAGHCVGECSASPFSFFVIPILASFSS